MLPIGKILVVLLAGLAIGQSASRTLAISWDFSGQPFPRFSTGGLISYDLRAGVVRLFDGGVVRSVYSLSLPGAAGQVIRDVARSGDGTAVVLAGGQSQAGGYASAIVWLADDGNPIRIVKTDPFVGAQALFQKDGSLWVLGRVPDERFENVPGHRVLRRYDAQGRLLGESLAVESFAAKNPVYGARMVGCGETTGMWVPATKEWVELSASGEIGGRWRLPDLGPAIGVSCLAGRVYATVESDGSGRLLELTKQDGQMISRDISEKLGGAVGIVVGSEGSELVVYTKGPSRLLWIQP